MTATPTECRCPGFRETAEVAYQRGREDERARWESALHMSRLPSRYKQLLVALYEGER